MTDKQIQILKDYNYFSSIKTEDVISALTLELIENKELVSKNLLSINQSEDIEQNNAIIELYWLNSQNISFEKEFNLLLENKFHYHHQRLVKYLQDKLKYESSIPVIDKLLSSNLQERYAYTGSEDNVIAKWFSHALAGIGTESALEVIKFHANSNNGMIANEMKYRLNRIKMKSEKRKTKTIQEEKENLLSRLFKNFLK